MSRAAERARTAGVMFAYHNHGYDTVPLGGRRPIDLLAERTDAAVQFQLDVFWMLDGGGDPLAFMRRWPGRIPSLHLKDRAADGAQRDIGAGTIDWRAVLALRETAGADHYFLDIDDPPDPFASMRSSFEYLSRLDI